MTNAQKFFKVMLELSLEGMTFSYIQRRSELSASEILQVMDQYSGILSVRKIGEIDLIYLRRPRALKTAYTFFQFSDTSKLEFPWSKLEYDFFYVLSDPKFKTRSIKTISKLIYTTPKAVKNIAAQFQKTGIICKRGNRISFTMLGFPIWATLIIGRIFLLNE